MNLFIMVRVKRGKTSHKRRKKVLKETKGFRWGRKSKYKLAKNALQHALLHSYRDRKRKKREFRRLWQVQINAACRKFGFAYNKFIHGLKEKNIQLDRKVLAQLAKDHLQIFEKVVEKLKE